MLICLFDFQFDMLQYVVLFHQTQIQRSRFLKYLIQKFYDQHVHYCYNWWSFLNSLCEILLYNFFVFLDRIVAKLFYQIFSRICIKFINMTPIPNKTMTLLDCSAILFASSLTVLLQVY